MGAVGERADPFLPALPPLRRPEMETGGRLSGEKLLGHQGTSICINFFFFSSLHPHTFYLWLPCEVDWFREWNESKLAVACEPQVILISGRSPSADLRKLWVRYLRLVGADRSWQGSETTISPLFDQLNLCNYCTLKLFLYPLFLSLPCFSVDIFIVN